MERADIPGYVRHEDLCSTVKVTVIVEVSTRLRPYRDGEHMLQTIRSAERKVVETDTQVFQKAEPASWQIGATIAGIATRAVDAFAEKPPADEVE